MAYTFEKVNAPNEQRKRVSEHNMTQESGKGESDSKERKEEQKELALRIIDNVFARLDVKNTIVKQ